MLSSKNIKKKIQDVDPNYWWGDDFDVRFYLLKRVKEITGKKVLDVGGGIGIICSEIDESNLRINLDLSFKDLKMNKEKFFGIENICASMTHLPFVSESIDCIICANILEVAKKNDIQYGNIINENEQNVYPSIEKIIVGIKNVLNKKGKLFLTTPNNLRYKSTKLTYFDIKQIQKYFNTFSLFFFNDFPKLSEKSPKFNLANVIPKILLKFYKFEKLLNKLLIKDEGYEKNSVSFYVEAEKNE
jgi:2-polyprenyl-3-methyl-5-hydroxy-6-metoxy-1,4-benzoquinol methylase